jgi:hypothetical protein
MKKYFQLIAAVTLAFLSANAFAQSNPVNARDSMYQRSKTDSVDFRTPPVRTIPDTAHWKTRDSLQIDDKNPKKFPQMKTDTFPK